MATYSINVHSWESLVLGAIAVAISTTIGAGVLGLPKALYLVGPIGFIAAFLVAFFLLLSAMMLSDMLQREKKPVQLTSLLSDILGDKWKYVVYITLILSMYGALSAYLLGFSSQLNTLTGISGLYGGLLLFLVGGYIIFKGTRLIEKIDIPFAVTLLLFLIFMSLVNLQGFSGFEFNTPNTPNILTFVGTMMFALFGLNVIPEINFLSKGKAVRVYAISTFVSLALYLLFAFTTVGVLGSATTGLGTKGLALHYGGFYGVLISLFTITALITSFLGIGLGMMHVYLFDFKFPRYLATLSVVVPPLAIFLFSGTLGMGFLDILGLAGELTLPLFVIMVSYAYHKILPALKPKTPFPKLVALTTALFYAIIFASSVYSLIW